MSQHQGNFRVSHGRQLKLRLRDETSMTSKLEHELQVMHAKSCKQMEIPLCKLHCRMRHGNRMLSETEYLWNIWSTPSSPERLKERLIDRIQKEKWKE